jgi:serine/threonine-protein kinase
MTGEQLGHYRVGHRLGKGGMGEVYEAEDTRLKRRVALKVLPPETAADPARRARFEREAQTVAALNHPNIVTLHSIEQAETPDGSVHFITMELVEGNTLADMLKGRGLPLARVLEIARSLADAVGSAHRAGITHRDLKPQNVMIGRDGRIKVLDFGLAKLAPATAGMSGDTDMTTLAMTQAGAILGTFPYMSPEQAQGQTVDPRSDVFSLGVILYEMACGKRPFHGDTPIALLSSILKDTPRPLTGITEEFGSILGKCLAKSPADRYEDGQALLEALSLDDERTPMDLTVAVQQMSDELAGRSVETVDPVILMQEEERKKQRQAIEGYKLVGLIIAVAGIGAGVFLYVLRPGELVFVVALVPLLVGVVFFLYAMFLAPKPD